MLGEAAFAVDVACDHFGDTIRKPKQHGLVAGPDGQNPRVVAQEPDVLEEQRKHRVLPVLAVKMLGRLEAGDDVADPRPHDGFSKVA